MSLKKDKEMEKLSLDLMKNKLLDDSLQSYIAQISQYEVLSNEEQLELLKKYRETNDKSIFDKLVNHNLRAAIFVAKKYNGKCVSMSFFDLIQEANIALIKALNLFDFEKGTKLSTYIINCMIKAIQRQIDQEDNVIRRPVYVNIEERNYSRFLHNFYRKNERIPTEEEIINGLNINEEKLKTLSSLQYLNAGSLNFEFQKEEKTGEVQDLFAYEEDAYDKVEENIDTKITLIAVRDKLSPKEYYIIFQRILNPDKKTLVQTAEGLDITRERVRQIESRALKKLQRIEKHKEKVLKKYTLDQIKKERVIPLFPIERSFYGYLKENLAWLTYYFIYTKREKGYKFYDYVKEFEELSEEEIKNYMDFCEDLEKELFTEEKMHTVFMKEKEKTTINDLFSLDLMPERKPIDQDTRKKIKSNLQKK